MLRRLSSSSAALRAPQQVRFCSLKFYAKAWKDSIDLSGDATTSKDALMLVHLEAPKMTKAQEELRNSSTRRKEADLLISTAIDVSGSMHGNKLAQAKNALEFVATQLNPKDHMGLVSFGSDVTEESKLLALGEEKTKIEASIAALSTRGCTNLSGGLLAALGQLPDGHSASSAAGKECTAGRRHITMLFTDGQANEGITSTGKLCQAVNRAIDKSPYSDETVYTFGFGADHDEKLLAALAEATQGNYFYIQKPEDMAVAFAECLGGLKSVSRRGLKIELEPRGMPGIEIAEVLTVFPTETNDERKRIVTLKDIYAEEKRDLLVRLRIDPSKVDPTDKDCELPLLTAKLTCVNEDSGAEETYTADVRATLLSKAPAEPIKPNAEVEAQRLNWESLAALERLTAAADAGNYDAARAEYRSYERCAMAAGVAPDTRFESDIGDWKRSGKFRSGAARGGMMQQRAAKTSFKQMMMEKASSFIGSKKK